MVDLRMEAFGYAVRVAPEYGDSNFRKLVSDIDDHRRIMHMIYVQGDKTLSGMEIKEAAKIELALTKIFLNGILAKCAAQLGMYKWVDRLLSEGFETLSSSGLDQKPFHEMFGGYPTTVYMLGNVYVDLGNYLETCLREAKIIQGKNEPASSISPDITKHPLSLGARLDTVIREQEFREAAKLNERIREIGIDLITATDFVRWVSGTLIIDYMPSDVEYKLSSQSRGNRPGYDNLHVFRRNGDTKEVLVYIDDFPDSGPLIRVDTEDYDSTVFGLVNSDSYLLRFDRFLADVHYFETYEKDTPISDPNFFYEESE